MNNEGSPHVTFLPRWDRFSSLLMQRLKEENIGNKIMVGLRDLFSPRALFFADAVLCLLILNFSAYTEIDWTAYVQEVEGYLGGELDYTKLKGDTGPLVYPGGFVYLYSALYYITNQGTNVFLAQLIFCAMYLTLLSIVLHLYGAARVPFAYSIGLIVSRRLHSIFLLRLFNDGAAMLVAYAAFSEFCAKNWKTGALWYSVAVSIKMNVLLFAPGLLFVWIQNLSVLGVMSSLTICATTQLVLGLPFLTSYPLEYLSKAFELSRVFTFKWSVNFKFLPEEVFLSKALGIGLLALTIVSWAWIARRRWRRRDCTTPRGILLTLFESNIIGIIFSRTLHYQFYSWFFHQVPFLLALSCTKMKWWTKLCIFVGIEYAFTKYPSNEVSSGLLMSCFAVLWWNVVVSGSDIAETREVSVETTHRSVASAVRAVEHR